MTEEKRIECSKHHFEKIISGDLVQIYIPVKDGEATAEGLKIYGYRKVLLFSRMIDKNSWFVIELQDPFVKIALISGTQPLKTTYTFNVDHDIVVL